MTLKTMLSLAAFLGLTGCATSPAPTGSLNGGLFKGMPLAELRGLAETGDAEAQFEMGERILLENIDLETGQYSEAPTDKTMAGPITEQAKANFSATAREALPWMEMACDGGNTAGCSMAAYIYRSLAEDGEEVDMNAYVTLLERGAKGGDVDGMVNFGNAMITHKDADLQARAFTYLKQAEADPDFGYLAYRGLGLAYTYGLGGQDVDLETGFSYLQKCTETDLQDNLCHYLYARFLNSKWDGPTDKEQAAYHFMKAAEYGNAEAQWQVGMNYLNGNFVEASEKEAFKWVERSALQGNVNGMTSYAVMHAIGQGVTQDYDTAYEWYSKLAEQGEPVGLRGIGAMYFMGEGRPADKTKGFAAVTISAFLGADNAEETLSAMQTSLKTTGEVDLIENDRLSEDINYWLTRFPEIARLMESEN